MDQSQESQGGFQQKIKKSKSKILSAFIVALAIVCFSLSIFAMYAAVTFFSYMFSLTDEIIAKAYLSMYYNAFLALTYLAILGLVIVASNTAVHFTQFTQKQRMIWIHVSFYLAFFICGIVALVQQPQYTAHMITMLSQPATQATTGTIVFLFESSLAANYLIYKGQVASYFIGYCICFFAYGALFFYSNYSQKRERQQAALAKITGMNEKQGDGEGYDNVKNLSFVSADQNSF